MPLILAIEPDRRQAAQIKAMVRARLEAELVLAESAERALAEIGDRIPDLVLTSALLSPKDEVALDRRLRALDGTASYVQTLTIPMLAVPEKPKRARGMLSALRRERPARTTTDGCDPAVFAAQCAEYLERAKEERALYAAAAEERKFAAALRTPEALPDNQASAPAEAIDQTTFILLDSPTAAGPEVRFETAWPTYQVEPIVTQASEISGDEPVWHAPVADAIDSTSREHESSDEPYERDTLLQPVTVPVEDGRNDVSPAIDPVAEFSPVEELATAPVLEVPLSPTVDTHAEEPGTLQLPAGEPTVSAADSAVVEAVSNQPAGEPEPERAAVIERAIPQWLGVRCLWPALEGAPVDAIALETTSSDSLEIVLEWDSMGLGDVHPEAVGVAALEQFETPIADAVASTSSPTTVEATPKNDEPLVHVVEPAFDAILAGAVETHAPHDAPVSPVDTRDLHFLDVDIATVSADTIAAEFLKAEAVVDEEPAEPIEDWLEITFDDVLQPEIPIEAANSGGPLQPEVTTAPDALEPAEKAAVILVRDDESIAGDSSGEDVSAADGEPVLPVLPVLVEAAVKPTATSDRRATIFIEEEPEPIEDEWTDLESEPWAPLKIGIHQLWPSLDGGIGTSHPIAVIDTIEQPPVIAPVSTTSPPSPIFARPTVPIAVPAEVPPPVSKAPARAPIAERVPEPIPQAIKAVSEAVQIPEVPVPTSERVPVVAPKPPPHESADVAATVASAPEPVAPDVPRTRVAIPETQPAPVPAPPVVALSPPAQEAARPEWIDVIESLKRDVERLQAERAQPPLAASMPMNSVPVPAEVPATSSLAEATAPVAPRRPPDPRPKKRRSKKAKKKQAAHDEWGFFDPEQCGFSALLTKLDEVTNNE
jgi:hypothetical protein